MTRIVIGCVIAGSVTLLALWLVFSEQDLVPADVSTVVTPPLADRAHDSPMPSKTEARKLELFQEIVRARQAVLREVLTLEQQRSESGRLPAAPSVVSRKDPFDKSVEANRRIAKRLADIAYAHGITLDEIEGIYLRGEVEGWPTQ